jgi:hypothetical protein
MMQIKLGDVKPVFRLHLTKNISPRNDLDLFSDVKKLRQPGANAPRRFLKCLLNVDKNV